MTPDSVISRIRSLPSRVRSPTPANTEGPPKLRATRMIISWISTVLPTPAPPNRPIFPPLTYGASRSSTLMPVSSISVFGSRSANAGGLRWVSPGSWMSRVDGGGVRAPALLDVQGRRVGVQPLAEGVEPVALGHVADGHRDRRAGVLDLGATDQAV